MKKTLVALMVMAGSTFAQAQYPASGTGGPGYDPNGGQYGAPAQSQYPTDPGVGPSENYPPAGYPASGGYGGPPAGYSAPGGAYGAPVPCGPGYVWIDGYIDGNGYVVNGYCAVPPYVGAYWIGPTFFGGRFVAGYWGRGGYGPGYGFRGGYSVGARFNGGYARGYAGGFRAPVAAPSFHAPAAGASGFRSQGNARSGGSATHGGGGSGHGGRR